MQDFFIRRATRSDLPALGRLGAALMRLLEDDHFACILLDVQMPGLDGFETAELIKGRARCRDIPILFVTVRDSEQDIVFALESGADDYMIKPARQNELLARVHALLRRAYPREDEKQLSFPPFDIDIERSEIRRAGAKSSSRRRNSIWPSCCSATSAG